MHENEIGKIIVDSAFKIHNELGPGLLESVYEIVLTHELNKRGLRSKRQHPVKIDYDHMVLRKVLGRILLLKIK